MMVNTYYVLDEWFVLLNHCNNLIEEVLLSALFQNCGNYISER